MGPVDVDYSRILDQRAAMVLPITWVARSLAGGGGDGEGHVSGMTSEPIRRVE